jgi:hypothetical protein
MVEESDNESLKFNMHEPLTSPLQLEEPNVPYSTKSQNEKVITLSEVNDDSSNEDDNRINIQTNANLKFTPKDGSKHKKKRKHKKILLSDKKRNQIRRLHYGSNRLNIIAMVRIS